VILEIDLWKIVKGFKILGQLTNNILAVRLRKSAPVLLPHIPVILEREPKAWNNNYNSLD